MAQNYFTDYPERVELITKHSDLAQLAIPLEDTFGEKGTFKTPEEAMEFFVGALTEMGRVAGGQIRSNAEAIDREGAHFKNGDVHQPEKLMENLKICRDLGVFSGPISKKSGGLNLPRSVQFLGLECFGQACPNTGLTIANYSMAGFFERWATPQQLEFFLPKLLSLDWTSSMALTEPGAGSDLGKLRTVARKNADQWIVNGTKLFISGGHSEVSFILARTDSNSTGLDGLSVLIAQRHLNGKENFKVAKIEDKVCLHSSATCEMVFEDTVAELLGPEGEGWKVMSDLMNEARLAMSALAVGIATGAMDEARRYARTRTTMGKPIIQHPMVADMLHEMDLEIKAMRALVIEACSAYDWLRLAQAKNDPKEIRKWKKRYRRLTPLCKYYCAEKAITIAKNAVQIFGGYGVCREYPVERLWRESIIYPIYEGTSQIQSLMVLKDTLKDVATQATGFLGSLAGAWAESKVTRDPVKSKLLLARNELNQGISTILMSIIKEKFKSDIDALKQQKIQDFLKDFSLQLLTPKSDLTLPFLWAERFTRITCDYYAIKCMADHHTSGDLEHEKLILDFAELAIPRMQLENHYMVNRLPSTLDFLKKEIELAKQA